MLVAVIGLRKHGSAACFALFMMGVHSTFFAPQSRLLPQVLDAGNWSAQCAAGDRDVPRHPVGTLAAGCSQHGNTTWIEAS